MRGKTRVLLVEDNEDDIYLLTSRLADYPDHHFEVECARTLRDARRLIVQHDFDAVMLDYRLHQGFGTELLDELLHLPNPPRLVLCSANEDSFGDNEAMASLRRGEMRFLSKRSLTQEELFEVLTGSATGE